MRTMSKSVTNVRKWVSYHNGVPTATPDTFLTHEVKYLRRSDVAKGVLINSAWRNPTAYQVRDYVNYPRLGEVSSYSGAVGGPYTDIQVYTGDMHGMLDVKEISDADMGYNSNSLARAEIEAVLKVRDQKVHVGNFIAEGHKSVEMIGTRLMSLYGAYKALRKGDFKTVGKHLGIKDPSKLVKGKSIANGWLELQYGWIPLLQDIHGVYEDQTKRHVSTSQCFKVSRTILDKYNTLTNYNSPSWGAYTKQDTVEERTKVVLWYYIDNPALARASSLGLINPLEVAWELTPFSFIVDWFVPVGNYLAALTAEEGTKFLSGTFTRTKKLIRLMSFKGSSWESFGLRHNVVSNVTGLSTGFSMDRGVYTTRPTSITNLYYKSPVSTGHALNALALFRGLFK